MPKSSYITPQDGISLLTLLKNKTYQENASKQKESREKPLVFSSRGRMAIVDNGWKLVSQLKGQKREIELFNLEKDPSESNDLFVHGHYQVRRLRKILQKERLSIDKSVNGNDYKQGNVTIQPPRIFWTELPVYQKYFQEWKKRPEYKSRLNKF